MSIPVRTGRGRRRLLAAALVGLAGVLAAVGGFGWKVVYRPTIDPLPTAQQPVDALIVLGPLEPWRVPLAERYMREHRARNLVLSTPNMPWDALYCKEKHPWPAYCFPPDPSTTRGEAMGLKRLAEQHGWHSFAVLTIDFHVDRARFIFQRCLRQPVPTFGPRRPEEDGLRRFQVPYQLAGFAKELVKGPCPR